MLNKFEEHVCRIENIANVVEKDENRDNADVVISNLNFRIIRTWFKPGISHVAVLKNTRKIRIN